MSSRLNLKIIDQAYQVVSRDLQALNLFHSRADIRTILAIKSEPKGSEMSQTALHHELLSTTLPLLSKKVV